MKKKTYKDFQEFVTKRMAYYRDILNLNQFMIYVSNKPLSKDSFTTRVDYPYLRAYIDWSEENFKRWIAGGWEQMLERGMLHETIHIILWELARKGESRFITRDDMTDVDERTTDYLTTAIARLLKI